MKIEFFFTEGHTHTATNVFDIVIGVDAISYVRDVNPDMEGVVTTQSTTVSMDDMLYAVIYRSSGVQIVPGIYSKFAIMPVGQEVVKQNNIETEARNLANRRALRKAKKQIKSREGYAARNEKRRVEFAAKADAEYARLNAELPTSDELFDRLDADMKEEQQPGFVRNMSKRDVHLNKTNKFKK